jgi:hypothetical protein
VVLFIEETFVQRGLGRLRTGTELPQRVDRLQAHFGIGMRQGPGPRVEYLVGRQFESGKDAMSLLRGFRVGVAQHAEKQLASRQVVRTHSL